jgi:hypothetical protein
LKKTAEDVTLKEDLYINMTARLPSGQLRTESAKLKKNLEIFFILEPQDAGLRRDPMDQVNHSLHKQIYWHSGPQGLCSLQSKKAERGQNHHHQNAACSPPSSSSRDAHRLCVQCTVWCRGPWRVSRLPTHNITLHRAGLRTLYTIHTTTFQPRKEVLSRPWSYAGAPLGRETTGSAVQEDFRLVDVQYWNQGGCWVGVGRNE